MRSKTISLLILFAILISVPLFSEQKKAMPVDFRFLYTFSRKNSLAKDIYLTSLQNKFIICKATVKKVSSMKRYGMKYRVVLEEPVAPQYGLKITYYLFLNAWQ